jgi:hypothetical protein
MLLPSLFRAALLFVSCFSYLAYGRSLPRSLSSRALATTSISIHADEPTDNSYGRTAVLSDGTLLLGYVHVDDGKRTLEILQSTDGGATFNQYGSVAQRDDDSDMDNIFLLEVGATSPPTVLAAFRNHDKNDDGAYTWFRITVCKSVNGGKDWLFASQAVEFSADSSGGLGIWEPFMRTGADGKVQLYYSRELTADNQQTFRTISEDGSSWGAPVNLLIHPETVSVRDGMVGIVKVKDQADGRDALVMVYETTSRAAHNFNVEYAVSYDDGATFPTTGVVWMPADSRQAGGPQITTVGDNGLAVLFMTDEGLDTQNWPSVAQIKSVTSSGLSGGTVTWSTTPELVGDSYSHWPGLLSFSGKVFGVYDQAGAIVGKFLDY